MITAPVTLEVWGHPKPKGSMVCTRTQWHGLREQVNSKDWQKKLADMIRRLSAYAEPGQPIAVDVIVSIARPASQLGTGRNRGLVKASAPEFPVGHNTGDIDKHARQVLDALQRDGQPLNDDCQVVELHMHKTYAGTGPLQAPGVRIVVRPAVSLTRAQENADEPLVGL